MKNSISLLFVLLITHANPYGCLAGELLIARFSEGSLTDWQSKEFSGLTRYDFVTLEGKQVLHATADKSASGLFRETTVDLDKYPFINWTWRIETPLSIDDETVKKGDDYAARLYVVLDGGVFFWKTKALNYVWSSASQKLRSWPNAFAGKNAMMVALRTSDDQAGVWYHEKRNIREDFKKFIGKDIHAIDAVAIMTDTDNSKSSASAYYGDIYFSSE